MKVTYYDNQIIYIEFDTQKELSLTFVRPQEFYESGLDQLRGQVFSFETFVDSHVTDDGKFTYFHDWRGYNIPGNVLEDFFDRFEHFTHREMKLRSITQPYSGGKYYVIAGSKAHSDVLDHELVHAHYYLNEEYHKKVNQLVKQMDDSVKKRITDKLIEWGYADAVIVDEINAYMATSKQSYIKNRMKISIPEKHQKPFIDLAKTVLS